MDKRIIIDITMTVLMHVLMSYSLTSEMYHEIFGIAVFILFLIHHYLNRWWYKSLKRRKKDPVRIFCDVIDILLFVFMILQPLSGIMMSRYLFRLNLFPSYARSIHLFLAHWGFVLLSLHIGTHLSTMIQRYHIPNIIQIAFLALGANGVYAFMRRRFMDYMFLRTSFAFFDFDESLFRFFFDHFQIMATFAVTAYFLTKGDGRQYTKKKKKKN